jgi:hypothetical protein
VTGQESSIGITPGQTLEAGRTPAAFSLCG